MNRREFASYALAAASLLAWTSPATTAPLAGTPTQFSIDQLRKRARHLASEPMRARSSNLPRQLNELTYDQYRDIRYRPTESLWGAAAPFSAQFFHLGLFYKNPVRVFEVSHGKARELHYDAALFDFGQNQFDLSRLNGDLGFAGFRIHSQLNSNTVVDELIAFLGASYFRAVGRGMDYGLSARGLALGTASEAGEEFPFFSEFYLERPQDRNSVVVHALLDSPSVTGVYTFSIRPGKDTVVDVAMSLYTRRTIDEIGIAPLTSMFFFAANDRVGVDDFRPEVHDSDGLAIWTGTGEWIWRPLVNPQRLRMSTFADRNPRGFGLMQRNRRYDAYQDLESHYERRPSVWVEPLGHWGPGGVMLIEIPTREEVNDNIVAFWRPEQPLPANSEWQGSYRLHWCLDVKHLQPRPAVVVSTRSGHGQSSDSRRFVLEFAGPSLPKNAAAKVSAEVSASRGELRAQVTHYNSMSATWRTVFELLPEGDNPIELRCSLKLEGKPVTETWCYQWTA